MCKFAEFYFEVNKNNNLMRHTLWIRNNRPCLDMHYKTDESNNLKAMRNIRRIHQISDANIQERLQEEKLVCSELRFHRHETFDTVAA